MTIISAIGHSIRPEPLGHEPFGLELMAERLTTEGLMAERLVEGSRVVRRFETALYGTLFRGQSKKRYLHARLKISFKEVKCYNSLKVFRCS